MQIYVAALAVTIVKINDFFPATYITVHMPLLHMRRIKIYVCMHAVQILRLALFTIHIVYCGL